MSFGIDFGTTNSATVELVGGNTTVKHTSTGNQPFPSILAIDRITGQVVERGIKAREAQNALRNQCEIIKSAKSLLGKDYSQKIGPRTWTAKDFASEIFKGLKELVGPGKPLDEAVVAIPVNFRPNQRKELREAAEEAGISIKNFVSEPTAALFKNIDRVQGHQKVVVFDWGGGTLDIALLKLEKNQTVTEIATDGIELGGDDLDLKIAEYIYGKFHRENGLLTPFYELDRKSLDRLLAHSEEAKCSLSKSASKPVYIPHFLKDMNLDVSFSRDEMLELLGAEYTRAVNLLKKVVLNDAGLKFSEIGCVLMVGGSSRIAGLHERIEQEIGECVVYSPGDDSDWEVASGAALLSGLPGTYILASNMGVELSDGSIYPLLQKGQPLQRCEGKLRFGIVEDVTTARFNFSVVRGEWAEASFPGNTARVGTLLVPCNGFVNEALDMAFQVDEDLTLQVTIESISGCEKKVSSFDYHNLLFNFNLPPQ